MTAVLRKTMTRVLIFLAVFTPVNHLFPFAFIFAGEGNGIEVVTHVLGYTGAGANLTITVGIDPTSANAADMEQSTQNVITYFNCMQGYNNNLILGAGNNIPSGAIDFESTLLHEMGHSLGLAHVNAATESGLPSADRNYTKATDGADNVFNLNAGGDGIKGSADDVRGDDVNLHYYNNNVNNPCVHTLPIDATNYSRALGNLPAGDNFPNNADRDVTAALGFANTECAMQQGAFFDEDQRLPGFDDIAGLMYANTGLDELNGTGDDYTFTLVYSGLTAAADIVIDFDNAQTGFAVSQSSGSFLNADHVVITATSIFFNTGSNWFFNTEVAAGCSTCPNAGDIVITEIMQNPNAVGDNEGEWFEVYNTTGADIDMNGWEISDDGTDAHTIGSSVIVPAGGYAVLARNGDTGMNGGVTADYVYGTDIALANGDDEVVLSCSGTEIDRVNYDGGPNFPDPTGASMNLNPMNLNATDNDTGSNWCEATSTFGSGDMGTPGAANDACTIPCSITAISTANISACNPSDDSFTADVTVTYSGAPGTGTLDLTGDGTASVAVGSLGSPTSHTFVGVMMTADGGPISLTATFSDLTSCTFTEANAGTAPMPCAPPICSNPRDIAITEIMNNPSAVGDGSGEWFEVYNTTGSDIDLNGWVIRDLGSDAHTISSSVIVPANGYAVLGNNDDMGTNGGAPVDYDYGTDMFLSNAGDEIILECNGTIIDEILYDGGPIWPDPDGASMNLDPGSLNATDNDDGLNWCESITPFGSGDLGTPGAANISCNSTTVFTITITDPCSCNDDATLDMSDGTFDETVTVTTNPAQVGLTLLVGNGSVGLIGVNIGDPLTDNNDGTYSINFDHADGVGYTLFVAQDITSNIIANISNTCYYPLPAIDPLPASVCLNDAPINLTGSAQLGDMSGAANAETETWSGPGVTGTTFDPSAAGAGMHQIIYEYNAQDDDPDAQHPGCISSVSTMITVNAIPDAPTAADVEVCDGEKAIIEPMQTGGNTETIVIASDDFDAPVNLTTRSNTTDLGTVGDHEDQFTSPGDLFGITDGMSGTPMPRQAPFALSDDAADPNCNGFFAGDNQGVLPCNYGNNYFGVVDTENGENMGDVMADWGFDISSATAGVTVVCIDMGAMGDFEASDTHTWSVDIDGGGFNTIFMLEADEAAMGTYDITNGPVTLNDPMTLNGVQVLNGLTTFCADLGCQTGNVLTLRLELATDGGTEAVAYDNIEIYGSADPTQVVYKFYDVDPSGGGATPVHCGVDYCPPTTVGTSPETYWVTSQDCTGCESDATEVMVTINPLPTPMTRDTVICEGETLDLNDLVTGDNPTFHTTLVGAQTQGGTTDVATNPNTYTMDTRIYVRDTTAAGCEAIDSLDITVTETPTVDPITDVEACDGDIVPEIVITGTPVGAVFNWTNNNTSIGLGGAGTGNIPSFTAINPGPGQQVATITVTPEFTDNGITCVGTPVTFTITVFPRPIITLALDSITICRFDSLDMSVIGAVITDNGSGVTDGTWTTSGDGTFIPDDRNSTVMTYAPGTLDTMNGVVILTLTTDDPVGPCGPETATFELVLADPPGMACLDAQISIGHDGFYEVTPDDVLASTIVDWTTYTVDLEYADGTPVFGSPILNCTHKGEEIRVRVTESCSGNSCWSTLTVEDKIAPVITCPAPLNLDCNEDATPGAAQIRRFEITPGTSLGPDAGTVTNIPQQIPDLGNVVIQGVNIYMDVDMDNTLDYFGAGSFTLTSPAGTTYDIYPFGLNPNCQLLFGMDGVDHGIDDGATAALAFCQDFNTGDDFQPFGASLDATFGGEEADGVWTWAITDGFDLQSGTVNRLVIELEMVNALEIPMVSENCTYELTYVDINDTRNVCGVGQLTRVWTATDCSGLTSSCNQIITFGNITPPNISFPPDYEVDCFVDPGDLDPADLPRPFDFPVWNDGDCEQFSHGYDDQYFDVCSPYAYKIRRTWEIIDWCDPNFSMTSTQVLKVVDDIAPSITCPPDFVETLRHNDCFTNVSLPQVVATDNCDNNVSVTRELLDQNGVVIPTIGVPVGEYYGRYIAEDACGNTDTCFMRVSVVDPVAPVVVVYRNLVVSLTTAGWAYLCADQVDDGSNDNCTDVGLQIKRNDEDNWRYYDNMVRQNNCVRFQCRDLGTQIVWLRVWDDAENNGTFGPQDDTTGDNRIDETDATGDNYNESWAEVEVEDKLPPVLVCPPDISLNCLTDFADLEITGEAEADLNCDNEDPTYTDQVPHGYCPDSDIVRTFRVEKRLAGHDGVEGTADDVVYVRTCVQTITITDDTPVVIEKLPLDLTIDCDGGAVGTAPADLTRYNFYDDYLNTPTIPDDDSLVVFDNPVIDYDCEHIGVYYEDKPFGLCLPGSYKIQRNWEVIDWCDPSFEITYTNVILVQDVDAPVLTVNNPGTVSIDNNSRDCSEFVDLTASAFDLCSNVTITNNSPYGPGTHDASGTYPKGTYVITFTAIDGCGNVATEEVTLTVVDGKAPQAVCTFGLAVGLKANCEATFDASQLDAGSSDNCTDAANLTFEIALIDDNGDIVESSRGESIVFTCDHVGNTQVALIVIDDAGNEATCNTVVQVQAGDCTDPDCIDTSDPTLSVTGSITTSSGAAISNVEILVDGVSQGIYNGSYGVSVDKDANTGMAEVIVEADKSDVVDNGVTTLDLIMIRRDILQLGTLADDYAYVAADVNNDQKVSTLDMIQIRQAILKQIDAFTGVPSWRFISSDYDFGATTWENIIPFYYEVSTDLDDMEINFIGMKMGDVNGDADLTSRSTGVMKVRVADALAKKGEALGVSLRSSDLADVAGYQFTIEFDASALELINIEGEVSDVNFNLDRANEGIIAVSKVVESASSDGLFNLNFRALNSVELSKAISISSSVTRSAAYDRSANQLDVELVFVSDASSYALYQNAPNPFGEQTVIGFNMGEAGTATLTVLDVTGKVMYTRTNSYSKGYNEVRLSKNDLNSTGIMYYQLEAGSFVATKKMMMVSK